MSFSELHEGVGVKDMYIVKRATFPNFTSDDTEDAPPSLAPLASVIDVDFPIEADDQEVPTRTVLYCTVLYSPVLYCTMLYCSVCSVLYCTVLQVPHQAGDGDKVIEAAVFLDHVGYSRLAQVSQLALVSGHLNIEAGLVFRFTLMRT